MDSYMLALFNESFFKGNLVARVRFPKGSQPFLSRLQKACWISDLSLFGIHVWNPLNRQESLEKGPSTGQESFEKGLQMIIDPLNKGLKRIGIHPKKTQKRKGIPFKQVFTKGWDSHKKDYLFRGSYPLFLTSPFRDSYRFAMLYNSIAK